MPRCSRKRMVVAWFGANCRHVPSHTVIPASDLPALLPWRDPVVSQAARGPDALYRSSASCSQIHQNTLHVRKFVFSPMQASVSWRSTACRQALGLGSMLKHSFASVHPTFDRALRSTGLVGNLPRAQLLPVMKLKH